jgi:hypothetical protein
MQAPTESASDSQKPGSESRTLNFSSKDGTTLFATLYPSANPSPKPTHLLSTATQITAGAMKKSHELSMPQVSMLFASTFEGTVALTAIAVSSKNSTNT